MGRAKVLIVKLESYSGDDTYLDVSPNPLYCIVSVETGEVLDNGYRSFAEALSVSQHIFEVGNKEIINAKT